MNYRHIFHAGNFADVFKHIILMATINFLQQKEKGCALIDSHAGIGLYDLDSAVVQRNPEHLNGIAPLLKSAADNQPNPIIKRYLKLINELQPGEKLKYYPGSPLIMRKLLRPQDELILNELHPEDYKALKKQFHAKNIHIHNRNAYEFLPAILPPKLHRGLIFIDPPYEMENEFTALVNLLTKITKLFPQGIFLIWYPIVHDQHQKFLRNIYNLQIEKTIHFELIKTKNFDRNKNGLRGSGIIMLNTPYKIENTIKPIIKYLENFFKC